MEALTKELTERFGSRSSLIRNLLSRLVAELGKADRGEAGAAFETWKRLLSRAGGHEWWTLGPKETTAISKAYRLEAASVPPGLLLFAIHSCYALIASALARRSLVDTPFEETWDGLECPFYWCRHLGGESVSPAVDDIPPDRLRREAVSGIDLLRDVYHGLVPRSVRHGLGEYYTPTWLAEHVLDSVGFHGIRPARLLDPACGSGTFLLAAAARFRYTVKSGESLFPPGCLNGFDLNPVAVAAARANLVMATADTGVDPKCVAKCISLCDSILDVVEIPQKFDFVVGNPPWIAWDHLPRAYRDATRPLWIRYGLFSLSGGKARYGGGKKDLSTLLLLAAADRFLEDGGRLGFVVTQTLFQTKDAGEGFRRFRLGENGAPLKVLRVDDLSRFKPFPGASNWTAVIALKKGNPTAYPVPYFEWTSPREKTALEARPIDPGHEGSPWIVLPKASHATLDRLIGPSDYQARLGANTGGANGVYWVEIRGKASGGLRIRNLPARGKQAVPQVECVVEPDLLYPLVRWADLRRGRAEPSVCILLVQNVRTRTGISEDLLRCSYPKTFAYLKRFEPLLLLRAAYRRYQGESPFYSMYNVGPESVSPWKVAWRRMDRRINAAILAVRDDPRIGRKPVLCQETCVETAVSGEREAYYLLAELSGSIINFIAQAHHVRGGKSFGSPGTLEYLGLKRFNPENEGHRKLSELGRELYDGTAGADLTERIDRVSAELRGISEADVARMRERVV